MAQRQPTHNTVRRNTAKKKKSKYRGWIRGLAIVLGVLVCVCGGTLVWAYGKYKDIQANPFDTFKKPTVTGVTVTDKNNQEHVMEDKIVNLLIMGLDSDAEREAKNIGWRTDVLILCSVNYGDGTMTMMSIPRDSKVKMNKLDSKTGEVTGTTTRKINEAFAQGGGPNAFGYQNTMDCVKDLISCDGAFNIPIDYYLCMDMDGMGPLADSIGGVPVVLDRDLSTVGEKGEEVLITSSNVEEYLKNRKTGGNDEGRGARQQQFIISFIKKVQSMGAVKSATMLYNELIQFISTNMTLEEILAFAQFADNEFSLDKITQWRVPSTTSDDGHYYELIHEDELYDFVLEHFYNPKSESGN